MFVGNIRFALRHFRRQKLNAAVHLIGLTLGISVCIVIALFLHHELNFDSSYPHAEKIYRVNGDWRSIDKTSEHGYHWATPIPLANEIRRQITGVDKVSLALPQEDAIIQISPEKKFMQDHVIVVDPEFLDIFGIEVLKGEGHQSLSHPYKALLTESTSKKFFGNEDPIGKTIKYKREFDVTVTGVIRDLPSNTSLPISILLSYVNKEGFLSEYWMNGNTEWLKERAFTYVTLDKANIHKVEEQLKSIADLNINSSPELFKGTRWDFMLQPLRDIHFFSPGAAGGGPYVYAISRSWLWFFAAIGAAVLTLACINFINLSTAQAITRAREVGIRKFIGARRSQLITQFLIEAWILTSIAGILSVLIAQQALPFVNQLLSAPIVFNLIQSPVSIIVFLSGILITGILAGLYPAWIIARFNPVSTLRASSGSKKSASSWLRKGLVITQFAFSASLLMAVILMAKQVKYMQTKALGFERSHIITVEEPDAKKTPEFEQALNKIPGVKDVSFSQTPPFSNNSWVTGISVTKNSEGQGIIIIHADRNFYPFYGLRLLSGRIQTAGETLLRPIPKIVINEKLLKALNLGTPEQAIGKKLWLGAEIHSRQETINCEVIGVVSNFHLESLEHAIQPAIIVQYPDYHSLANIKLEEHANVPRTLEQIKKAWQTIFPDGVYSVEFLDQQINNTYKSETNLYFLFKIFSGVALLISCLGLWALVTYSASQRTKEIGIRKVLGATVRSIVLLLSRDFIWMLPFAFAIACPVVYYFAKDWLENFAYQVDIGWEVFVFAGVSVSILAVFSASVQTIRTAIANPVDSLRSE